MKHSDRVGRETEAKASVSLCFSGELRCYLRMSEAVTVFWGNWERLNCECGGRQENLNESDHRKQMEG